MKILRILFIVLAFGISLSAKFKQGSIIVDARSEALIYNILKRLCDAEGRDSIPRIYFIVDDNINAFATGEGAIYINTGLIIKLEDVSELVAVLAHELGHIVGGHIHLFNKESVGISAASIIGTLLGGAAALAGGGGDALVAGIILGQGAAQGEFASFSQRHEKDADAAAFRMMQNAGLSTEGGVKVFEFFKKTMRFSGAPYLKTHPSDDERVTAFKNFRTQKPDTGSIPHEWELEFKNIKAIFIANLHAPQDADKRYEAKHSSDAILAQAIILSRKGKHQEAFAKLDTLISTDPKNAYLYELYGQFLLESGRENSKKAVEKVKRAVELNPKALSIRLLYAQALYNNGADSNLETALAELNRITQDDSRNAMAWLLKSGILRKLQRNDEADIAQAEYANIIGDKRLAASRAKRAAKSKNRRVKEEAESLGKEIKSGGGDDD